MGKTCLSNLILGYKIDLRYYSHIRGRSKFQLLLKTYVWMCSDIVKSYPNMIKLFKYLKTLRDNVLLQQYYIK